MKTWCSDGMNCMDEHQDEDEPKCETWKWICYPVSQFLFLKKKPPFKKEEAPWYKSNDKWVVARFAVWIGRMLGPKCQHSLRSWLTLGPLYPISTIHCFFTHKTVRQPLRWIQFAPLVDPSVVLAPWIFSYGPKSLSPTLTDTKSKRRNSFSFSTDTGPICR